MPTVFATLILEWWSGRPQKLSILTASKGVSVASQNPTTVGTEPLPEKERGFYRLVFSAQEPRSGSSTSHSARCYETPTIERVALLL